MALSADDFTADIDRRRSGAAGTTPRMESDEPMIVSGLFDGHTTGAPLTILFQNGNTRSGDYDELRRHPRPSHADLVAARRFEGHNDHRGGGHFSGRLTLGLVAAGVVAKKMIPASVRAQIAQIGGERDPARFDATIEAAMRGGDSVGGIVECRAEGVPAGLGEPFFDSAESVISHLLFSIPAVKGVEFGLGFGSATLRGSQNNDAIISADGATATNNAGGIVGGLTNGNPLVVRVAIKPTASIAAPQQTFDMAAGRIEELIIKGRHDTCIALRAPVVVEAAVAIALADMELLGCRG
jgi:chorismate synthase